MATTIKTKHSTTAGNSPSSLVEGELAINVADGNFFYGDGSAVKQDFAVNQITASNVSASKIDAGVGNLVYNEVNDVTTTTPKGEIIKYGEADSAVSAGSIYMLHTDGKWKKSSATVEVSSSGLLGVAVSSNATDGFLIRGVCDLIMANNTPTGSTLYLTVQSGRATFAPTSASGNVIRAVGYTLSGGTGLSYFNPDATYIVAS